MTTHCYFLFSIIIIMPIHQRENKTILFLEMWKRRLWNMPIWNLFHWRSCIEKIYAVFEYWKHAVVNRCLHKHCRDCWELFKESVEEPIRIGLNYSWEPQNIMSWHTVRKRTRDWPWAYDDVFTSQTIFTNNISVLGNVQYN